MNKRNIPLNVQRNFTEFMQLFNNKPAVPLLYFHPFQCPVSISEIKLSEQTIQDYSVFSLFILRMFDAGITDAQSIADISGMSVATVKAYIEKEIYLLQHIVPESYELTNLGIKTLEENQNGDEHVKSYEVYRTVRRIHIDALTGTVIPAYLEKEFEDNIKPDSEMGAFILPQENTERDTEFDNELRSRLLDEMNTRRSEYVDFDYFKNGDIIEAIEDITSIRVFYRWMYLAKFQGMIYPMLVLFGKKSITAINKKSNIEGKGNEYVCTPLAIAATDKEYLNSHGIVFENSLVREDCFFEYLKEKTDLLELELPELPVDPDEDDTESHT